MSLALIQALEKCATKFEQYANYHGEKGSADKARENKAMVHMVNAAISSHYRDHKVLPLRIVEIDQHLVDLKRVQIVCPVVNGKFSLTMVSGIDAHCSDATMYEEVRQSYLNYMKWEQSLDAPSVTTVKAVGDVISLKSEVGQVKPKCEIRREITLGFCRYYIGSWHLATMIKQGEAWGHFSLRFQIEDEQASKLIRHKMSSFEEADKEISEVLENYFNRLFV